MSDAAPDADFLTQALIWLLDVQPGEAAGHYIGRRKPGGVGRVFGGQVVAQALLAATRTVPDDRLIHSLHGYFLRPGDEDYEIGYEVASDMDGRSFSSRRVLARQHEKVIFSLTASFQRTERGPEHAVEMPDVPPPESLLSLSELLKTHALPAGPVLRLMATRPSPIEIRPVSSPETLAGESNVPAHFWLRVGRGPLAVDQPFQRVILSFISDLLLLAAAYRPHGLQIGGPNVISASIDHSLWFHGDVECGDWLLYAMESPFAGGGRGFARGHFFDREGRLVASVAQEGLMRLREEG